MNLEEARSLHCPANNLLLNQKTISAMRGKSLFRERLMAYARAVMGMLSGFGQLVFV